MLEWEQQIWDWYERLSLQLSRPVEMSTWLTVVDREGWDLGISLALLDSIESAAPITEQAGIHGTRH